jgi:hypothetical protein
MIDEAQSNGNLGIVDVLFTEDFVDHTPFPGVPPTRAGLKMLFGYYGARSPIFASASMSRSRMTRRS